MENLLKEIGVKYRNLELYLTAFNHASYAYENNLENNERLEFLGDAVIELLMSDYLYKTTTLDEGSMTKRRAQAVREEALVLYSKKIDLPSKIKLGRGESVKGPNRAIIADTFEALFGAIYLDLGFGETKRMFNKIILPHLKKVSSIKDHKSILQEYIQSGDKRNISYHTVKESGPSHDKKFEVVVKLDGNIVLGKGFGKTKKQAEQMAAKDALKKGNYDLKKDI